MQLSQQQRAQGRVETGGQKALPSATHTIAITTLTPASFAMYPPQAHALVQRHFALLRELPLPLLPLLLREMNAYDWRFPRERERIDAQLNQLSALSQERRTALVAPFAALQLPPTLAQMDWVADPGSYLDTLTATLWSSGQMPAFRQAAKDYANALPVPELKSSTPRQVFVVLDGSLTGTPHFSKLRERGVMLRIADEGGLQTLLQHGKQRAAASPQSYAHWYLDGAAPTTATHPLTTVSYDALAPVRTRLLQRAHDVMSAERSGPEELRSLMAHTTPEQIGMSHDDPTLAHFQLSLLTEGSGTQIFATSFAQWAARECLRRAEPSTLLVRFTPRQAQQGMNEMLAGAPSTGLDSSGSLIDAEQGAYYTWINLNRLSGAEQASFLAWHAGSGIAVAIGPGLPRGTASTQTQTMQQALKLLA